MRPRRRGRMVTDLGSDARTMARGAAANVAGALGTTFLSFVLSLLITHVVNVGRFGLFSIAATVILLAQVPAVLGLDTGAVRFVALGASDNDDRTARGSLQTCLIITAVTSGLLTAVLAWQAPWLTYHFFHKPEATHLVRIVSLSLPGLALTRVVIGGLQGLGVMTYSAWLNPVRALVNILSAAPLLAVGLDVRGLAIASIVTAWGTLAVAALFLLRVHPTAFVPSPADWAFGRILRFSLPQTLTTTLLYTILWTDTLLLGRLRVAADVGVYTIVQRLLSPAQTISTATGQMFAPRIAAEDARGDRETLGRMLKQVTYWNIAMSIPVFAILLLVPGPLLGLFGASYGRGATALAVLAAGQLFNAATGPLGQMINMSGRPYVTLVNNGAVAGLNIAGCLILIPRYGVTGAALSTTAAITLVNVIKLVQVRVIFRINPFRVQTLWTIVAALLAVAVVVPLALIPPWPNRLSEIAVAVPMLLLSYGYFFWVIAAGTMERELLSRRVRSLLGLEPRVLAGAGS